MRKGVAEGLGAVPFDVRVLADLERKGYKYVQIKGLTMDRRYDYMAPHLLVLVPLKELPADQTQKDIYEPIGSRILAQWAKERNEHFEMVIAPEGSGPF